MKSVFVVICLITTLLFTTTLFAAPDTAAGKEIYTKKCASCHGATGEAKESIAKMMKVEMKHLGAKEVLAKSDADLKKDVLQGFGKMKGIAGIDAKGADDVVAYMRTFKK